MAPHAQGLRPGAPGLATTGHRVELPSRPMTRQPNPRAARPEPTSYSTGRFRLPWRPLSGLDRGRHRHQRQAGAMRRGDAVRVVPAGHRALWLDDCHSAPSARCPRCQAAEELRGQPSHSIDTPEPLLTGPAAGAGTDVMRLAGVLFSLAAPPSPVLPSSAGLVLAGVPKLASLAMLAAAASRPPPGGHQSRRHPNPSSTRIGGFLHLPGSPGHLLSLEAACSLTMW